MKETAPGRCYHCDEPIDPDHSFSEVIDGVERHFCCQGCLGACLIIYGAGEGSYYRKRTFPAPRLYNQIETGFFDEDSGTYLPPEVDPENSSITSYDLPSIKKEFVQARENGLEEIQLAIEGIHCSSCVFLNERILSRTAGIKQAQVHYETGRAVVLFDPEAITISRIIAAVRSIGYDGIPVRPGQKSEAMKKEGKDLLWKMAFSGFFAGNVMFISAALYFGFFDQSLSPVLKDFFHYIQLILATPAYLYSGSVFHRGWKSFLKTGLAGMDLLISSGISVAYFYSIYVAMTGGEVYFDSVTTIIFFLLVGRYFEWMAKYNQRIRMEELVRPLPAHCKRVAPDGGKEELIAASDLQRNDTVRVRPDEYLPTDGTLLSETCEVDESVLTGESLPVVRTRGDRILAGSRIVAGVIDYRVDSLPGESSLSVLSRLADTAGMKKSNIEQITLRIIPWFSNIILTIAVATALLWYFYLSPGSTRPAIEAAIAVLIISCPCALALAVPTAIGSSIYLGLTGGLLIRDGEILERFSRANVFLFDKTGTLTVGRPRVIGDWFSNPEQIDGTLVLIEKMESGSAHPVGQSLVEYGKEKGGKNPSTSLARGFLEGEQRIEKPGLGVAYTDQSGELFRITSVETLSREGLVSPDHPDIKSFQKQSPDSTIVGLASSKQGLMALFALQDQPAPGAYETIQYLKKNNFQVVMVTGDNQNSADHIARHLDIDPDQVYAGLLPDEKEAVVEKFEAEGSTTCMVGDGYNDAVALSRASVSAVLSRGAPLSLEHAGMILLQNELTALIRARKLTKKTLGTVYLNLGISLTYNGIMIPIAAAGLLFPIWCALFMSASSLTVVGISILLRLSGASDRKES